MRKWLLLSLVCSQICLTAVADSYLPMSAQMNNRMFSTEETRPLMNLEREKNTNQAIMNIETKYSIQPQKDENLSKNISQSEKPKGLKSWFKGFVIEW